MKNSFQQTYTSIKRGYQHNNINGVEYMTIPQWDKFPEIIHAFSTRNGGVSKPPYDSLNLDLVRPSSHQGVFENFERITEVLRININDLVQLNYAHGDGIEIVDSRHKGMGLLRKSELPTCDAIITKESGVVILTTHADCASFLIYNPVVRVVAACHAGWRGMLLKIGQKTIEKLSLMFGSNPEDCCVGIGPCICGDCFEVDLPVAEQFGAVFPDIDAIRRREDGKYLIDLVRCAAKQFLDAGLFAENITIADECTYENVDRYYSYRRDKPNAGSMAGFLGLL